jgi:hypothetical protein
MQERLILPFKPVQLLYLTVKRQHHQPPEVLLVLQNRFYVFYRVTTAFTEKFDYQIVVATLLKVYVMGVRLPQPDSNRVLPLKGVSFQLVELRFFL